MQKNIWRLYMLSWLKGSKGETICFWVWKMWKKIAV